MPTIFETAVVLTISHVKEPVPHPTSSTRSPLSTPTNCTKSGANRLLQRPILRSYASAAVNILISASSNQRCTRIYSITRAGFLNRQCRAVLLGSLELDRQSIERDKSIKHCRSSNVFRRGNGLGDGLPTPPFQSDSSTRPPFQCPAHSEA